jgi:hypothetical protein
MRVHDIRNHLRNVFPANTECTFILYHFVVGMGRDYVSVELWPLTDPLSVPKMNMEQQ